ncbi:MAG: retroviral-like aspartic protease family protein [Prevotellaceae bacterium]|jgi:clan AA aspartic protease (TIGR02281 family)|nr:retroviral-like aspartic protease family protein [Prevotellaceae bacterium]
MAKYPFTYKGKRIIVHPKLNGSTKEVTYNFLLDTGAEVTVIDDTVAQGLGYDLDSVKQTSPFLSATGDGTAKIVHLKKLELLGRKEKNFRVYVCKFPIGMVDGLIGVDFMVRLHAMKINFDAQEIEVT